MMTALSNSDVSIIHPKRCTPTLGGTLDTSQIFLRLKFIRAKEADTCLVYAADPNLMQMLVQMLNFIS